MTHYPACLGTEGDSQEVEHWVPKPKSSLANQNGHPTNYNIPNLISTITPKAIDSSPVEENKA